MSSGHAVTDRYTTTGFDHAFHGRFPSGVRFIRPSPTDEFGSVTEPDSPLVLSVEERIKKANIIVNNMARLSLHRVLEVAIEVGLINSYSNFSVGEWNTPMPWRGRTRFFNVYSAGYVLRISQEGKFGPAQGCLANQIPEPLWNIQEVRPQEPPPPVETQELTAPLFQKNESGRLEIFRGTVYKVKGKLFQSPIAAQGFAESLVTLPEDDWESTIESPADSESEELGDFSGTKSPEVTIPSSIHSARKLTQESEDPRLVRLVGPATRYYLSAVRRGYCGSPNRWLRCSRTARRMKGWFKRITTKSRNPLMFWAGVFSLTQAEITDPICELARWSPEEFLATPRTRFPRLKLGIECRPAQFPVGLWSEGRINFCPPTPIDNLAMLVYLRVLPVDKSGAPVNSRKTKVRFRRVRNRPT